MSTPAPASPAQRCGIDSVEIARIERLLRETSPQDLLRFFTAQELADAGEGPEDERLAPGVYEGSHGH